MQNWKGFLLLYCLVFPAACGALGSGTNSFSIAAPADWVNVQTLATDLNAGTNSTEGNVQYVLLDDQVNVRQSERYRRVVEEPVNADGVQSCVQLSMDYDPSYEHLVIHDIVIRRGTNILDLLDPDKIKIIQQEKDLDMNIYNGEVSAVVFLDDVRIGDQIDYSYTICGSNPIFAGHYMDSFEWQWGDAVTDERYRLLWPTNRFLGIKNHGTDIQPVVKQRGSTREYTWELHNIPTVNADDSLPSWYDAYSWIQFSEFASWKEVREWAARLYPPAEHLDPKLQEKVSEWERSYPNPEDRLTAALAFVQDEIRYMGIEVGPNSHQPNDPSLVFARRFGDCKDKAYLFCTLLHAMGIDASEALVDTDNLGTIADWLPSPYAFDHVVTQVRLNGKTYWLDPTELHQGGAIDNRFFPNYGYCLLVQSRAEDLTAIPQQRAGWPKTTIQETFVVRGRKDPADFTVQTLAEGSDADQLREDFADKGRDTLGKNYLNYYAHEYPKIKIIKPLEVFDHREQNTYETIEHYQIQGFWVLSDDKQNFECEFYPQSIRDLFDEPTTTLRSMPLSITYPHQTILKTRVILPEAWPVTNEVHHFENTAARLDAEREAGTNTFQMEYDYRTLTNFVSPDQMPAYIASLGQMKDAMGYSLTWVNEDATPAAKPDRGRVNWTIMALAGVYLLFLGLIAVGIERIRRIKPAVLMDDSEIQLSGLRGWLIIPAIGLIINPIRVISLFISTLSAYGPDTWHTLTDPSGAAYNSLWAPLLIYELLVNLTVIVFTVLLLALFFQRRRIFPGFYITFLAFAAVTTTLDNIFTQWVTPVANRTGTFDQALFRDYFACLIWIPYMIVSKRVKATFVR